MRSEKAETNQTEQCFQVHRDVSTSKMNKYRRVDGSTVNKQHWTSICFQLDLVRFRCADSRILDWILWENFLKFLILSNDVFSDFLFAKINKNADRCRSMSRRIGTVKPLHSFLKKIVEKHRREERRCPI